MGSRKSDLEMNGPAYTMSGAKTFWKAAGTGKRKLTKSDFRHIRGCEVCQEIFTKGVASGEIKISSRIMSNIEGNFREEVIRTICLKAVGGSVFN